MEPAEDILGEESVYVVLDLKDCGALPAPGSQLRLEGMETGQPTLQLADGTRLVGAFEETVGTQLILADTVAEDGSHRVELVTHTDRRINFSKQATAAELAAAAAAAEGQAEGGAAAVAMDTDTLPVAAAAAAAAPMAA